MEKPDLLMKKSLSNCRVSELKVLWVSSGSMEPLHSLSRMSLSTGPSHTFRMSWAVSVSNTMKCRLRERAQLVRHSEEGCPRHPSTLSTNVDAPSSVRLSVRPNPTQSCLVLPHQERGGNPASESRTPWCKLGLLLPVQDTEPAKLCAELCIQGPKQFLSRLPVLFIIQSFLRPPNQR